LANPDNQHIIRRLADTLQHASYAELVTYDDLSEAIGQDVRLQPVRLLIYPALTLTADETGAVFKNVSKKGYRRMHPTELPKLGRAARSRIRRQAGRSTKFIAMGSGRLNDIPPDAQQAILRELSVLGLIQTLAQDRNLPTVEDGEVRPMTAAQTAQQFLDGIGTERKKKVDGSM
jgi:hypothetical protein